MDGPKLLLIEDDVRLCRLVKEYLEGMGYFVTMEHNGLSGLNRALGGGFDAIILDLMLPGIDGLEVLRRLRQQNNIPVLMLTGRAEEADRIVGLELGADDYLPKTFSTRELLARLRAVMRRAKASAAAQTTSVTAGELSIDVSSRGVMLAGEPLVLTTHEFDLLLALARAQGRVMTREALLLEVAERDFEVFDRSIDVAISGLRRKLGDDARTPRWIETIRGVGYLFKKQGVGVE